MTRIALNGLGRIGKLALRDLIDSGAGGEIVLPRAYVLDDAPGREVFVLITDDRPMDVLSLQQQAQRGGAEADFTGRDGRTLAAARGAVVKAP